MWSNFEVAVYAGKWVWRERARCLLCGDLVGWSGSSGNLKRHLQRNHPEGPEKSEPGKSGSLPGGPVRMYGKWLIDGNSVRLRKHEIWNYFYQECLPNGRPVGNTYVTCILCGREMVWRGKGLGKLRNHLSKIHSKET